MSIQLPSNRLGTKQIQLTKRNIPLDQIIAVQGQNPLATGIETAGNAIGQAIQKRSALRQQGQQLAQALQMAGQPPIVGDTTGMTPETALAALKTKAEFQKLNEPDKKKPLGTPFIGKDGNAYQYFYDEKSEKTTAEPLPQGLPPQKPSAADGTLVQSGLFDTNGQPIMVNNKTGKPMTIGTGVGMGNQVKTMLSPTSQTRSTAEFANTLLPHIQSMKQQIADADAKGYIGPAAGRIYGDFLAGKVGSTGNPDADQVLGRLRATDSLMKTGAMKVHFGARGGGQMYDHFSELLNTGKQSAAMLNGSLDGIQEFIQGYADAGKGGLKTIPAPLTGAKKSLADKLGL